MKYLLLVLSGLCVPALRAAEPPNVILIITDDQGYGDMSCHGNPVVKTPHLDRLHAESVRLTDFHVAPMCTPTRGQLMTGVDCLRNRAMNVSSGRTLLRRDLPTMADLFAAQGYATGLFGKWHLGDNYPYRPQDRGFQETLWFPSSHVSSTPDFWNNDYFDDTYIQNGHRTQLEGYCTDVFFREAIDWMKSVANSRQPFFLYLATNAPHGPLFVPDKYRPPVAEALKKALPELPDLEPAQQTALVSFLAMITNLDENLGRLETVLRETGLRDNTILIFLTDNGSTMGHRYYNAGMKGNKTTLWEGGHRVPCFLRWPAGKLRPAGDVAELTQVQDLLPTLIDLCGLEKPTETPLDGASLAGLLQGKVNALTERMLVINYSRMPISNNSPVQNPESLPRRDGAAVLWNRWRLLNDRELYHLETDPLQRKNVMDEHPDVLEKMRAHLDQWWDGVKEDCVVPERVIIGSEAENPTQLSACEWYDVFIDQQRQVRQGVRKNGWWYLEVAEAGEYEFKLRRWPRESGLPLTANAPALQVTDGSFIAGTALPIHQASIEINGEKRSQRLKPDDRLASFRYHLKSGPIQLQTWFQDQEGQPLCGAYYVSVRKLE